MDMSEAPRKKRVKIVSACSECRRKKTKCNGEQPCGSCEKSVVDCIYPNATIEDNKRGGKLALEAIEDRLKTIEDMLKAILETMPAADRRLPSIHNLSANLLDTNRQLPPLKSDPLDKLKKRKR